MAGSLIFAASDAQLGQPEIELGVFAPAASCLLPSRIGQAAAEDLLFSGRSVDAAEAKALGLVHAVATDPEIDALEYFDRHFAGKSAAAAGLRYGRGPERVPEESAASIRRGRAPVPAGTDEDARRERGTGSLPRQASTALGTPLREHR
jgi:cyclohexa-1,5-dienecarbonyl-CoA hydratase